MANRMARHVYGAADHVVALSPGMRDGVLAWGVPVDRITVIPNCSDTHLFGGQAGREEVRAQYGVESSLFCIHPGAMGLVNGLDYLLECGKELDARGVTDIHIALIGDGTQKSRLIARLAQEQIRSVTIHDSIQKREMPRLLAAADVGIVSVMPHPAMEANSANKFFDFLAAGIPVLLNYGGWQAEALHTAQAGLSVSPHEPVAMADVLMTLRDDPEARKTMGRNGRRLAEEEYDRDLLAHKLEGVLTRVADARAHRA
jgi:glycosyltransferase involved in cell wall biosynthesis